MWLPTDWALGLAVLAVGVGAVGRRWETPNWLPKVAAFVRESALILVLYALWRVAGSFSILQTRGAMERGRWLHDFQQAIAIPSEAMVQGWFLPYPWLIKVSNIFYGTAHVPGMVLFLIWLFWRHREHYPWMRNTLVLVTTVCLLIQLLPLAPPRFLDELGVVDTGILYGQSVYGAFGSTVAGQLQAMPSIHVAWAALIAVATMRVIDGPWRWIGPAHLVITTLVVVITGNHFWLDGGVAVVILAAVLPIEQRVRTHAISR